MTNEHDALIAEARDWEANEASWGDNGLVTRLADALEAATAESDPFCREEACQYRHWTSGSMPTHRKGNGCPVGPEPQPGDRTDYHAEHAAWPGRTSPISETTETT